MKSEFDKDKIIQEIVTLEEECHIVSKEYSKAYSERTKILKKFTIPENKLLKELENRKIELRAELLKIKRDIQHEKHLEFKRKKTYRKTIPEITLSSNKIHEINTKQTLLYNKLNEYGQKYPTLYSQAYELYKKKRDGADLQDKKQ